MERVCEFLKKAGVDTVAVKELFKKPFEEELYYHCGLFYCYAYCGRVVGNAAF